MENRNPIGPKRKQKMVLKRKRFFLPAFAVFFLFTFMDLPVHATHIVGGNFEWTYQGNQKYLLTLRFFFDDIYGDPDAKDRAISVSLFDKGSNVRISNVVLNLAEESLSQTEYNDCENYVYVRTRYLTYQALVNMPQPTTTSTSFYIVHERCCRNSAILNINNPGGTGMTYYIEQPYVIVGSQSVVNSSPRWDLPTQIKLCKDKMEQINFQAFDLDGDSLSYEMADPIAGYSSDFPTSNRAPTAKSAPYKLVDFINGHSKNKSIMGNPALGIDSKTGLMTVRPSQSGIFVFAVICREFRNGKQIGLVQREIQIVVWDCPTTSSPQISAAYNNVPVEEKSLVTLYRTQGGCIDLKVVDTSANAYIYTFNNSSPIFDNKYTYTLSQGYGMDTLQGKLCFPKCELPLTKPSEVKIVAKKFFCGYPIEDTLRFLVEILDTSTVLDAKEVPNVFTPNKDGQNDVFLINNIPPDNCEEKYLRFEIYNRWGSLIFTTPDRKVVWNAENVPDGQYFYFIVYDNRKIKGTVQVLR